MTFQISKIPNNSRIFPSHHFRTERSQSTADTQVPGVTVWHPRDLQSTTCPPHRDANCLLPPTSRPHHLKSTGRKDYVQYLTCARLRTYPTSVTCWFNHSRTYQHLVSTKVVDAVLCRTSMLGHPVDMQTQNQQWTRNRLYLMALFTKPSICTVVIDIIQRCWYASLHAFSKP